MPNRSEIDRQVAFESQRRARLGVPALAGGVLYLLGGITISATLKSLPTVGVVQALTPALRGEVNPAVSPGAAEVRFISHHAFGLIAGNLLQAISIVALVLVLLFILGAVRFRRPQTTPAARLFVLLGGAILALVSVVRPVVQAVNAHNFTTGHDFTAEAVNRALTHSALLEVTQYLGLLAGIALTGGMIVVVLGASRTGLLTRWMMVLGIFMAVVAFTPFGLALGSVQQLVPAFWMVAVGILLMGRWPNGDPPAWAAGEARPWPSQAERAGEREGQRGGRATKVKPALSPVGADVAPEPAQPAGSSSGRRRRKRGARR
jgi:hypothetical protein